ncbi:MAG: DUF945 domain-containing protein [Cyanobacteria bacterium SZAS LIN-2]|nr:DUF945 domain-containing protein [Cyanobacteria bacterium SZAS LIN-2]
MNILTIDVETRFEQAFRPGLSVERLQHAVPAAFAERPSGEVSATYRFISTRELVGALLEAGFVATEARQARARGERAGYARHLIRFRPVREVVVLDEAIPEIIIVNSHDGTSAYQVRAGLYRPVCTNGLIAKLGDFGVIHVPHRGNVVANVVEAATRILSQFEPVAVAVKGMALTHLSDRAQLKFAEEAVAIRWRGETPVQPRRLLEARRPADVGDDLWRVYNTVQENLIRGGVTSRAASGRLSRTRGIRAIREDVRINTQLWQAAVDRIEA